MSKWVVGHRVIACGRPAPASSRGTPPCPAMRPGRVGVERGDRLVDRAPPGTIRPATAAISASMPASSAKPQAYVSSQVHRRRRGSTARPARSARGRPPRSPGRAAASSARRNRPNSAVAAVAASRRAASSCDRSAPSVPEPRPPARRRTAAPPCPRAVLPVQVRTCPATSMQLPAGGHVPGVGRLQQGRRGSRPASRGRRRAGRRRSGPGVVAVGVHQVEHLADLVQPAGDHGDLATAAPRRRTARPPGRGARGTPPWPPARARRPGVAARAAASASRVSASRAAKPSGERSVSRSSWPATPT